MTRSESAPRSRLSAEQRRESILAAATQVFAEHGYRRGKVAEIAARIGVTEPVVFQNFGTKSALFRAVVERAADTTQGMLAAAVEHGVPVSELLRTTLLSSDHVERFHCPGSLGALFAEAAALTADPEVGAATRGAIARVAAALADLLAHGQRAGDIRDDLDPAAASWWLVSLLSARTFRTAIAPDPGAVEAQLAAMTLRIMVN